MMYRKRGTTNAKEELSTLLDTEGCAPILAAEVSFRNFEIEPVPIKDICTLVMEFQPEELTAFWEFLDCTYDSGYGGQELFGTVWLKDGSWLVRGEYDGSEWWRHCKRPSIPKREEEGEE